MPEKVLGLAFPVMDLEVVRREVLVVHGRCRACANIATRRAKRLSLKTSCWRRRTSLVAGPESWSKASSTAASSAASAGV